MRILFNATAALPGTSGAIHTVGLLTRLSELSDHEFVLLTTPGQQFLRELLGRRVAHYVIGDMRGAGVRTAYLQARLGALQRRTGADVVYNKGNFYAFSGRRQVCFIENTNPFSTLHLDGPPAYKFRNVLLRHISDQALRHADAVIFPTEHARKLITQRSRTRVPQFVVPYGWELPDDRSAPEQISRRRVLCVSSVLPYKNLPLALDGFAALQRRGFDGELVIVGVSGVAGSGAYQQRIKNQIDDLGLADSVRLMSPVGPDELAGLYRSSDCLVMPSLEESFGIPLIEAMGLGTPIAAAEVTGPDLDKYFIPFREICGEAAEYFSPFDAESCANAMARALDPARRTSLIEAGRRRADRYSWRAAAEGTLKVFASLS
jgi:glycosyltransferase involved in cell wall biosynthesis